MKGCLNGNKHAKRIATTTTGGNDTTLRMIEASGCNGSQNLKKAYMSAQQSIVQSSWNGV
eukprot:4327739-Amphidinium_carterae.1